MAKIPFNISKNEQYIECHRPFKLPNGKYSGIIRVYELLNTSKANMLTTMDWSFQPVIVDPNSTTGYNSLRIDDQLVDLEKLVQDLCKCRFRVNKLGYCYFQIMRGVTDTTEAYGFAFYRLNDMLKWSDYGVTMKLGKPNARILWDRLDILHGSTFDVNKIQQEENNDIVNDQQKAQIQKLTFRVKELEAQLDQKDNNDIVNNQQRAQIQKLTDRVKELEVQHPLYDLKLPQYYVAVPTHAIANFLRQPNYPEVSQTILQHLESPNYFDGPYTPTCVPAPMTVKFYTSLSIELKESQWFDTSNWYFVAVKELSIPVLVYEGTMYSVNVAGHAMSSPIDGSAYIGYMGSCFRPLFLVGVGHRIAIRRD